MRYNGALVAGIVWNSLGMTVVLSEFLQANDAVRVKEGLGTHPRVFYSAGHGQNLGRGE